MPSYTSLLLIISLLGCGLLGSDTPDFFTVTPVSAVEAALELHADKGDEITIYRNGNEIFSFKMSGRDTILTDSGLEPATSYIWKADNDSRGGRWRPVEQQATTLDTTSHAFTWHKYEFGKTPTALFTMWP